MYGSGGGGRCGASGDPPGEQAAAEERPFQRAIGTREPDERQLEVGRAALAEILRVELPPDSN